MKKPRICTSKEFFLFQQRYCRNERTRLSIIKNFKVEVEVFEELPPGYGVYGATGTQWLLKDSVIMLKLTDMTEGVCYYPVFSEAMGKKLLKAWGIPLPPKMSAFVEWGHGQRVENKEVHYINARMRSLMAFTRLFMLPQERVHEPLVYGFKAVHEQLHDFPKENVSANVIKFVNDIIRAYQADAIRNRYTNCRNLQDFIEYIKHKYTLLEFKDSDFSALRAKLLEEYPDEEIYF